MNTKLHVIAALIFALIAIVIIACTKTSSTPPLLITSPMIDNQDSTEIDSDLASMVDIVRTFTQSFVNSNVDTATFVELAQAGDFVEYYRLLGIDSTEAAQMTANFINHLNSFKVRYNVGNDTCSTCLNHTDTSEVIHGTAKILQLFKDNPNIGSEFFSLYLGDEIVHPRFDCDVFALFMCDAACIDLFASIPPLCVYCLYCCTCANCTNTGSWCNLYPGNN